jgi:single-stranded DNA-binding protein
LIFNLYYVIINNNKKENVMQNKNMCIFSGTVAPSQRTPTGFKVDSLPNGQQKMSINLLVQDSYQTRDGQQKIKKQYVEVTVWGKKASELSQTLQPNAFIEVVTSYSKTKGKNGVYYTNFTASKVDILAPGQPIIPQQQSYQPQPYAQQAPMQQAPAQPYGYAPPPSQVPQMAPPSFEPPVTPVAPVPQVAPVAPPPPPPPVVPQVAQAPVAPVPPAAPVPQESQEDDIPF